MPHGGSGCARNIEGCDPRRKGTDILIFELLLGLLLGATLLSLLARRLDIPYPTLLAVGGAGLALILGLPSFEIPPDLILALFVAPILFDAAYDSSPRDLKRNWRPIVSLVLVAVLLTALVVAILSRQLVAAMPWAAAIALGALLAPPDAIAAIAVLRQVNPPHRVRMILEGESLLNDASSLLIYRAAVGALAVGGFSLMHALPTFPLVIAGSVAFGWLLAYPIGLLMGRVSEMAPAAILQFITVFLVWLLAEQLHLSAVVTIVTFGLTSARRRSLDLPANLRVSTFAVWETATFVLNVLAFTMIGLQLRPIVAALSSAELVRYSIAALIILAAVILIRLLWVGLLWLLQRLPGNAQPRLRSKEAVVVGWSGMRGIVTLAAAMALPAGFPYRDFIELTAFVVVLGTLLIQGLTLGLLVRLLRFPEDDIVATEVQRGRAGALKAALAEIEDVKGTAADRLRRDYQESLTTTKAGGDPFATDFFELRRRTITAAREELDRLRRADTIGDDAYRIVEEELDWTDLSAGVEHA